jgi:two-component system sensor kinase FixL
MASHVVIPDNDRSPVLPERKSAAMPPATMRWNHAAMLIVGYVALDWASYIHALHGLNITPWSPAPALGLAFVMRYGARTAGVLFVAIVFAEWVVRDLPISFALSLLLAAVLAAGYTAIGELMRRRLDVSLIFDTRGDLLWWTLIVVAGTLAVSTVFVTMLAVFAVIPGSEWLGAITRYWIGDGVGVLVTMPLVAMLMDQRGRALLQMVLHRWETLAYAFATVLTVALSVGLTTESDVKYFYVVFLPIVWAALRHGLAGAVITGALAQLAIITAVQLRGFSAVTVFDIQALTVVLVLLGFLVGVVIDEQRRMGAELRQSLRLAAAGEMAGALAHELNQPLTAMSAYGAACEDLINQGERGEQLAGMVRRMVAESHRTSAVVTRLRDFFRTGDTRLERVPVGDLLASAVAAFSARAARGHVALTVAPAPAAAVLVDRLQIEVVVRNLVANAFDAAEAEAVSGRWVRVVAERAGSDRVCISVQDSGPGLGSAVLARLFEPFRSSKSSGLGLGLAISRSIAEAHGGELWAEAGAHGLFKLVLPLDREFGHES